jgi:hypothetical protein
MVEHELPAEFSDPPPFERHEDSELAGDPRVMLTVAGRTIGNH